MTATTPNNRTPDELQLLNDLKARVATIEALMVARAGRVPHVAVDPTSPPDGAVWMRSDLKELRYRANGTTGFAGASGAGAPAGTGSAGEWYYDTTNLRTYQSDGVGWVVMSEPAIVSFATTVTAETGTITTVGATSFVYTRCDGWLNWYASIAITTNGTGATSIFFTTPIAAASGNSSWGHGIEASLTGKTVWVIVGPSSTQAKARFYDNTYPGGSNALLHLQGRYRMTTRYS